MFVLFLQSWFVWRKLQNSAEKKMFFPDALREYLRIRNRDCLGAPGANPGVTIQLTSASMEPRLYVAILGEEMT
jgi:hypothetical protein